MPRKSAGKEKTRVVHVTRKNGDIYVEERRVLYDPDKKRERILGSRLIGKIPKGGDAMVPTRGRRSGRETAGAGSDRGDKEHGATRTRVGMMDILAHVGKASGVDDAIRAATDPPTAQKIISVARYLVVSDGRTLPRMHSWQVRHAVPYPHPITRDVYHQLFADVGADEALMQGFFRSRCELLLADERSIAYDSTTLSTYSEQLENAAYGFNKAGDGLRTVKLLTLFAARARQPVAFEIERGDIADVASLKNALAQLEALGVAGAEIVTDNACYSYDNLALMLWEGFSFITRVKTSIRWVGPELDARLDTLLDSMDAMWTADSHVTGIAVPLTRDFERERKHANHRTGAARGSKATFRRRVYLHLYCDTRRRQADQASFREELAGLKESLEAGAPVESLSPRARKMASKYLKVRKRGGRVAVSFDNAKCAEASRFFGCFALVSNKERDCFEALAKYRQREHVEDHFELGKQQVDGARPRVWSRETLRGRLFVQFIALCYLEYLHEQVRRMRGALGRNEDGSIPEKVLKIERKLLAWLNKEPLQAQLDWFDNIDEVCVSTPMRNHRWNSSTTARDRMYLEKLGVPLS